MRYSTLASVAITMATLIWMVSATYRPTSLYADPNPPAAQAHAVASVPGGR